MDDQFIQVRLKRDLADRLKKFQQRIEKQAKAGRLPLPVHPVHGITLTVAIEELLRRAERDLARNERNNPNR